jgi:hypothetical protein
VPKPVPVTIAPVESMVAFTRLLRAAIAMTTDGDCGTPIVHDDGSIEYPKGAPPDIAGYMRDTSSLRVFHPAFAPCRQRILQVTRPQGHVALTSRCNHPKAEQFAREVTPDSCATCPTRRLASIADMPGGVQ